MSKSKTTGFPQQPKNDPKRKFKSRSEREAEVNRLVLLFAGILGAVIGVILGVALLIDGVLQPLTPVANVGGTSITTRDFQNRTRFERWRVGSELYNIYQVYGEQALTDNQGGFFSSTTQLFQQLAVPSQFGQRVLDQMIDNLLIRQYADANGISVADAEIDNQAFEDLLGYSPTQTTPTPTTEPSATPTDIVSPTPSPTRTPSLTPTASATITPTPIPTGIPTATPGPTEQWQTYQERRQEYFDVAGQAVGVSQNDLRAFFAEEVLRDKVMESVVGPAPTEQEQVLVRHILVNTEAEANDVLSALQNGESFAALARAVSQDDGQSDGIATGAAGSASRGGLLDWAGRGSYVDAFEEAVWNAEVGQVLGPIQTEFGYHIIQVTDKQVRPLIGAQSEQAQERAFREWLDAQREEKATTFSYWSNRVVNDPSLPEMGLPEELLFRSLGMQ